MGDKASRQSPVDEAIDRILQQRSFTAIVVPSNSITDLSHMKDGKPLATGRPGSAPSTPSAGSHAASMLDPRGSRRTSPTRQTRMAAVLRQSIKRPTTGSSNTGRRRNSAHSCLDMWSSTNKETGKLTEESNRMSVTVSTLGYTLSRSPSRVAMKIDTEKFFGAPSHSERIQSARAKSQISAITEVVALQRTLNEVREDSLRVQTKLHEQLADQAYMLEKEREKFKEEMRRMKADFAVKQQEAEKTKVEEIGICKQEHEEEIETLKALHQEEIFEHQAAATQSQAELKGELQFLQDTFVSYKASLQSDMEEKWQRRETEIRDQHRDEIEQLIDKAEARLEAAKTALKSELEKEHELAIQRLTEGHEQHLKRLDETCQQAAESLRELDRVTAELQSLTLQNESMEITIEQDKKTILSLQGELGETHAKLLDYESHFSQKVAEVEDQFRAQIHSLMTENTELRRRFMKKCDAYYHLQAEKDRIQRRQVKLLEQKMQSLVEVQLESQSQVSLVTQNLSPIMSTQLLNEQKDSRPISAPPEALANINDDNKVDSQPQQRIRPKTCGTTVRTKIPDVFR